MTDINNTPELNEEDFEDVVVMTDDEGNEYLYSIAARIFEDGQPAVENCRKFLAGGGSKHPIDMLRVAGVDMATPQPILDTIHTFETTLAQLKELIL